MSQLLDAKFVNYFLLLLFLCNKLSSKAQEDKESKVYLDSVFIEEVENKPGTSKVLHAEPLYVDLIRDLGARKGEKEWNVGMGLTDKGSFDEYLALVEYEWAPIDKLGLEVELPFTFIYPYNGNRPDVGSRLNSLKLAAQYTFLISEKYKTSLAIGYLHEFELTDFKNYGKKSLYIGNVFNPFFIGAKRWGNNFHTLIYTGPQMFRYFDQNIENIAFWEMNTNFHYMLPGTRNFIGIEFNKEFTRDGFSMVMRPQMRLGITETTLLGVVIGIPTSREDERIGSFLRLIYEPKH
jgi:hypothetical protein